MDKIIHPSEAIGTVTPPCSKSYAQRAIAAALLTDGESILSNLEPCKDTRSALRAVTGLGATVKRLTDSSVAILGGFDPRSDTVNTGESGLATRLFTPIAALSDRSITLIGEGSMKRRPVGMMIRPLRELGVEVESDGFLPFRVKGPLRGGETEVDGYVSSQFLTGLLIAAPLATQDTILHVKQLNSIPYIAMTLDTVKRFGIRIEHNDYSEFYIEANQRYKPASFDIEGDWSSAAFILAAGAIAGETTVCNMNRLTLQADVAITDALLRAGAEVISTAGSVTVRRKELKGFEFDATHCPDLFPVLAALAANCSGISRIKGVHRLIHKESDRAEAIVSEFSKMGIRIELDENDHMNIEGGTIRSTEVDSWSDHRIVMAEAVAALNASGPITIHGAEAVDKSYPSFWNDLYAITTQHE